MKSDNNCDCLLVTVGILKYWCEPFGSLRPWLFGVSKMSRLLSAVMMFGWLVGEGRTEVQGRDREVQPYLGSYQVGKERGLKG